MTDPELANRTYLGPMTPELVEDIIVAARSIFPSPFATAAAGKD